MCVTPEPDTCVCRLNVSDFNVLQSKYRHNHVKNNAEERGTSKLPDTKPETTVQDGVSTFVSTEPLDVFMKPRKDFQPRLLQQNQISGPEQNQNIGAAL